MRRVESGAGDAYVAGWAGHALSAGSGKSKKSSGETSMNVQNWPSLEGLGRHPALEALAAGQADGEAIDAFLHGQEFPLAEPGMLTFAWRGPAEHVHLVRWIHGGGDRLPFVQLAGTDLWLLRLPVEDGGRFEYKLAIGRHGQERADRRPAEPGAGGRSLRGELGRAHPGLRAAGMEPAARGAGGADRDDRASRAGPSARRARCGSICRRGTIRSGAYPLVVVHDGDDFVTYADLPVVLDNLIDAGEIPPVIAALVQTRDRLGEYSGGRQHPALPRRRPPAGAGGALAHRGGAGRAGAARGEPRGGGVAGRPRSAIPGVFGGLVLKSGSFILDERKLARRPHPVFHRIARADAGARAGRRPCRRRGPSSRRASSRGWRTRTGRLQASCANAGLMFCSRARGTATTGTTGATSSATGCGGC